MSEIKTVGIDLAKSVFYLVGLNGDGKRVFRKRCSRGQLLKALAQLPVCVVAMEACAGAHYWGREIEGLGHEVRLLPAQHVKAYIRGQKNDYNDAEGIAEASQHGRVRSVRVKTVAQQDEQALQRLRRALVGERTRLINRVRGLLAEYGVVMGRGAGEFGRRIGLILEDAENGLTPRFRALLWSQYEQFVSLNRTLEGYEREIREQARTDEACRRLCEIPGFGPVVSSAVKAWMGDGRQFRRGRDAAAALGVVPRQYSSGGKIQLLGITKRGDKDVRSLVVHGARAVVSRVEGKTDRLSRWIQALVARRGIHRAIVALANKLVRIAWVILARSERYRVEAAAA